MKGKPDVFFVNSYFQLFMAILIREMRGLCREEAALLIGDSSPARGASIEALNKYFMVGNTADGDWGTAYFFTWAFPASEVRHSVRCDKKILVYEGLTTYYTEFWCSLCSGFSIEDFDEVLAPSIALVENRAAAKYTELDCPTYLHDRKNLQRVVQIANLVFHYNPELHSIEKKYPVIFFDRDFERFIPPILKHQSHRLLTGICAGYFKNEILVKMHPYESANYYFDSFGFCVMKDKAPNELIYANMLLQTPHRMTDRMLFLMYNSAAAVNYYTIFGADNFQIVCLGNLLNSYGDGVERTLASYEHTRGVLQRLNQTAGIEIYYPQNIEGVWKIAKKYWGDL